MKRHDLPPKRPRDVALIPKRLQPRGFAGLTSQEHRARSQRGGRNAQLRGTGYRWDKHTASESGRKGGIARHQPKP